MMMTTPCLSELVFPGTVNMCVDVLHDVMDTNDDDNTVFE